jgi:hypothetical protein
VLGIEVQQPDGLNERQLRVLLGSFKQQLEQLHKVLSPICLFPSFLNAHDSALQFGRPRVNTPILSGTSYGDLLTSTRMLLRIFNHRYADIICKPTTLSGGSLWRNARTNAIIPGGMGLKVWLWSWELSGTVSTYRAWNAPQLLSPLLKISTKFGNGVAGDLWFR